MRLRGVEGGMEADGHYGAEGSVQFREDPVEGGAGAAGYGQP